MTDDEAGSIAKQRILALLDYYARDDRRPIRGLEMQRCALRVIERLQTRWGLLGPEALSQLRGVRANMSWANELLPASGSTPAAGFLAAPELRSFAV